MRLVLSSPEPFDIVESITDNYSLSAQEFDHLTYHDIGDMTYHDIVRGENK